MCIRDRVELGLDAVELGTGAYPGNAHCNPGELLSSDRKLRAFRDAIRARGLTISALSCHGNPLHPDRRIAKAHDEVFQRTVQLAAKLEVQTVITFSGCPGSDGKAQQPSWIVSPWPPEFAAALEWQWTERVVPYWTATAKKCRSAGVRVAVEMHPNFVAYNAETMLRLSAIAPKVIGCNFDPSHLFWQQADPVQSIRALGDRIFHVHAKDCRIDPANTEAVAHYMAGLLAQTPVKRVIYARLADFLPFPMGLASGLRERGQISAGKAAPLVNMMDLLKQPLPADWQSAPVDPDAMAVLIYSGGTTGVAKGIMLSHFALVANAHQLRAWVNLDAEGRMLAVLPLFHGFGMSVTMNAVFLAGAGTGQVPRFPAQAVLEAEEELKPTTLVDGAARVVRRGITLAPSGGTRVVLERRRS